MFRIFIVLLLLSTSLFAVEHASLKRAQKLLTQQSTKSILKAYHEYKNLRISAIMENDKNLQIKAIKGIIFAGRLLHIGIEKYRNELKTLTGKDLYKKIKKSKKEIPKTNLNYLINIRWKNGALELSFKNNLKENQIKYFILDRRFKKNNRYIFDIKAKINKNIKLFARKLQALRLNYTLDKKIRLVLESSKVLPIRYLRQGRKLIIDLGNSVKTGKLGIKSILGRRKKNTKRIIVIDAGHGGKDPGAIGYRKYREKKIAFNISKALKKELRKFGYKVFMTRNRDKFIQLQKRTAYANKKKADIFISIHVNSIAKKREYKKHHGIETYYLSYASSKRAKNIAAKENSEDIETMNYFAKQSFLGLLNSQKIVASNKLAIDLQRGMLQNLRKTYSFIKDGGVKKGPFWVLVGAQMPAVLIETGFITNPKEARYLVNKKYQQRMAHGLAIGIKNYFKNNP